MILNVEIPRQILTMLVSGVYSDTFIISENTKIRVCFFRP